MRGWWMAVVVIGTALLHGCGERSERTLDIARSYPLPGNLGPAHSLSPTGGRLWVTTASALVTLDTANGAITSLLPAPLAGRVVALGGGKIHLLSGTELVTLDPDGEPGPRRNVANGALAVGRASDPLLVGIRRGGIVGLEPGTLQPLWGWPERGVEGTALGISPLGDRVYQALGGDDPVLLTRDAQSGRILSEHEIPATARMILVAPSGRVHVLVGGRLGGAVVTLAPTPEGLETLWRESTGAPLAVDAQARLALSPDGRRLAVVLTGERTVHLRDARTGELLGGGEDVVDAAFSSDGKLLLLTPAEVRVVER